MDTIDLSKGIEIQKTLLVYEYIQATSKAELVNKLTELSESISDKMVNSRILISGMIYVPSTWANENGMPASDELNQGIIACLKDLLEKHSVQTHLQQNELQQ